MGLELTAWIKDLMAKNNFKSYKELAAATNCGTSTIKNIAYGVSSGEEMTLQKMAKALKITIGDIKQHQPRANVALPRQIAEYDQKLKAEIMKDPDIVGEAEKLAAKRARCAAMTIAREEKRRQKEIAAAAEAAKNEAPEIMPDVCRGGLECMEAIKAATKGLGGYEAYCLGKVFEYLWRYKGREELEKAKVYINCINDYLEGKK